MASIRSRRNLSTANSEQPGVAFPYDIRKYSCLPTPSTPVAVMSSANQQDSLWRLRRELLVETLAVWSRDSATDLHRPRFAHLHGVIAAREGRFWDAIPLLKLAVRLAPLDPWPYIDLAGQLLRGSRVNEGLGAYLRAMTLAPKEPDSYIHFSHALNGLGLRREAIAVLIEAHRRWPGDAELHGQLGDCLLSAGELVEALRHCSMAIRLEPRNPDHCRRLGQTHLRLREPSLALKIFRKGLSCASGRADLHSGLGEALLQLGRIEEARRAFRDALDIAPDDLQATRNFVLTTELLGHEDTFGAWAALGHLLRRLGRHREAIDSYRRAIARKPDGLPSLLGLARVENTLGNPRNALRHLEAAVAIAPEQAQNHIDLGLVLHALEQHDRCWDELAWYHDQSASTWRQVEQPLWHGEPLEGRTLLLWSDGSPKDTLLFLRYARSAAESGGRVVVECSRQLEPLVQHVPGVIHVTTPGTPGVPFDVHVPLNYLPALISTCRSPLNAVPYLSLPDDIVANWGHRLDQKSRMGVGIAWSSETDAGAASWPSLPCPTLAPLEGAADVDFIQLPSNPNAPASTSERCGVTLRRVLDARSTSLDLAALMLNLDLIICTDSSTAHIAGALGRPTWTLISPSTTWPWPHNGDSTLWYPTMRLFRSTSSGDGDRAVRTMRDALRTTLDTARSSN